jgi:xylulokinase
VVEGLYYITGSLYTSGACVEWFRSVLGEHHAYADLIAEAQAVPAGSQGVCFLPHFQLASPPYDDHHARGAFIGLSAGVSRGTLFRAVLEGAACDSRLMTEVMLAYEGVPELKTIYAIGGATRNALWMGIRASVLNRPLIVTDMSEAASLGAAMLGGLGAGVYKDVTDALAALKREAHVVEPNPADVTRYEQIYGHVYKKLYPALSPLHQTLHSLQ